MAIIQISNEWYLNEGEKIVFLFSQFDSVKDISHWPRYHCSLYKGDKRSKHYLVTGLGVPEGDTQIKIVFSSLDNINGLTRNYFDGSVDNLVAFWDIF